MAVKKKKRPANVREIGAGSEPEDIDFTVEKPFRLTESLNYYNYVFTQKDARAIQEKANRKIDWPSVPHSRQSSTWSWIIKMQETGCIFPDDLLKRMNAYFRELERDFPKVRVKKPEPREEEKGPLYRDKKYLAEFDDVEDRIIRDSDFKGAEQAFKASVVGIPKYQAEDLNATIVRRLEELKSKDRDVKEGFSHLTAREKKAWIEFYEFCLKHLDYIHAAKKVLAPRKPKVVPVEKKLKKLLYKKTDPDLGLASIQPEKLLGSKILWTYNTKYRELTRFESEAGFDLKGTTLQNVSVSRRKRIRKPQDLRAFFSSTRAAMDKNFEAIKTAEHSHPGRINAETMIMKAF